MFNGRIQGFGMLYKMLQIYRFRYFKEYFFRVFKQRDKTSDFAGSLFCTEHHVDDALDRRNRFFAEKHQLRDHVNRTVD